MSSQLEFDFYCPSCAEPATTETAYCKQCGADIRYVPRALEGGRTVRQRKFVALLAALPGSIVVIGSVANSALLVPEERLAFVVLLVAMSVYFLWLTARIASMVAHDRDSADPIFRRKPSHALLQPHASTPDLIAAASSSQAPTTRE
jgi:hypothetical protein